MGYIMNSLTDSAVAMPDVQSSGDTRHLPIQRVGVRGVEDPMLIVGADDDVLATVADFELTGALPVHDKGSLLSRFVALLEEHRRIAMTPALFCRMTEQMLTLLNAETGDITAS